MNELIIFGIICGALGVAGIISGIVENWTLILAKLRAAWRWLCDWLFDVQTAYYKFKLYRRRKKNV